MKIKSILSGLILATATASAQSAAIIEITGGTAASLLGVESAFTGSLATSTLEDFDGWSTSNQVNGSGDQNSWIDTAPTFSTAVGDFTLTSAGQSKGNPNNANLMIESNSTGEFGREVLASNSNDFWLDSNDAKSVVWNISTSGTYNAIGFYLADINDQGARIQLSYADGNTEEYQVDTKIRNASLFYTTIISDSAITGASLTFNNCIATNNCAKLDPNDGWGIDDITVGYQVTEPATIALFGLGLAGLGLARRRVK